MSSPHLNGIRPGWSSRFASSFALAGLFLLIGAGGFLQQQKLPPPAGLALAAGLVFWVVAAIVAPPPADARGPLELTPGAPRWIALALALAAAVVAWIESAGAVFTQRCVAAWAIAIAFWIAAWWPSGGAAAAPSEQRDPDRRRLAMTVLLLLILVGVGFRFYRLAESGGQPNSDHVEDLMNIVQLDRGERPIFFPGNTGQAPLPFYWTFMLHRALGLPLHFLTLKISTAIIGILAVPAVYMLGRELGGNSLGLFAAALLAWSKWMTLGARRGLTFAWAVFPVALTLWALLRYMRRGDRRSAIWVGLWLGLGQYGYNAFKIVPLMVPLTLGFALFDRRWRGRRWRLLLDGLLITATSLLVFLPLLHYMVQRPDMFWYRALTRAGTRELPLPGPALVVFARNVKNMTLAFHWRGDGAWINTVTGEPFLDIVTGALLLAGVILAVRLAVGGAARWAVVSLSLFFLTLASTLALAFPGENPGINRAAVAAPSVFVLAALPAAYLARRRGRELGRAGLAVVGLALGVAFLLSIQQNYESYFNRFDRQNRILLDPVIEMTSTIEEYRAKGVPLDNIYVLSKANWVDARNIGYELDDPRWSEKNNVAPGAPVPDLLDRPLLFLFHPSDARREELRSNYLGIERVIEQPFRDRNYEVYFVPRN